MLQGCNNGDAFRWGSKSFSLSAEAMDTWEKNRNIYANRYRDTSKRFRGVWNLMMLWKGSVMKLASEASSLLSISPHLGVLFSYCAKEKKSETNYDLRQQSFLAKLQHSQDAST